MSAAAVRILVVGTSTASTESTLQGLARSGWESHTVKTVCEADTVLRTIRFQLTLATEKLPDGTGYELAALVAQQTGNLFVSVPLSETCLWLPAVENGVRSLGERALNPLMLKTEAESILRKCDKANAAAENERSGPSFFSEVVRGKATTGAAAAAASDVRFAAQANEGFDHGAGAVSRTADPPRRRELKIAEKSREHTLRLVSEDVVRDSGASNKRWRA